MKYTKPATAIAAAIAMSASPLHAGGAAAPRIEPEVMEPESIVAGASSSGGFVLPLLFLIILAATLIDSPLE
ncbi:MAG: hypothetical protein GKR98_05055 [Boseongicola sp.]|nr:MAG: hypothetical protein GKR98_05055 [Boseongicola sp.]